jgi:hypothetical protein
VGSDTFFCDLNIEDFIPESEELPEYSTHTATVSDLSCPHKIDLDISGYPGDLRAQSSTLHGVEYPILIMYFEASDIK